MLGSLGAIWAMGPNTKSSKIVFSKTGLKYTKACQTIFQTHPNNIPHILENMFNKCSKHVQQNVQHMFKTCSNNVQTLFKNMFNKHFQTQTCLQQLVRKHA